MQIIPALDSGGAERTVLEITRAITDAGGKSLVISSGGRLEAQVKEAGGETVRLPVRLKNPYTMWRNIDRIARAAKAFNADILHARSRVPAWSALFAARRLGLPFITTYHGTYNAQNALKRFYNSVMVRGDMVIANSDFIAARIADEHAIDPQHIKTIYRGADESFFKAATITPDQNRQTARALGLDPDDTRPLLLLPGRLTRWKGQHIALEALSLLKKQGRSLRLLLPGDPQGRTQYGQHLQNMADTLGLHGSVILPGHISDMPAVYALADIVLVTSTRPEAFGRVAVEAQAAGCLAVSSALGGALETIVPEHTGFLVPPDDPKALARTIAHVLDMDNAQKYRIRQSAQKRAKHMFTHEVMCEKTLHAYHSLVKTG